MRNKETPNLSDSLIVISISARNSLIGIRYRVYTPGLTLSQGKLLAVNRDQNIHSAELQIIENGLKLLTWITDWRITI